MEQLKFLCDEVNVEKEHKSESIAELLQDLQVAMTRCNSLRKKAIILIDGINKVEENTKTHLVSKSLYNCLCINTSHGMT